MRNKLFTTLISPLLRALCAKEYQRFENDLAQPKDAQEQLLKKLLKDLARTGYGKQHGISSHENYESFVSKLPIQTYETFEPYIQKQLINSDPIITPHRVIHVEPTSGSSGPIKKIPYSKPLLNSFSTMFKIWAYDQLQNGFTPETGRIFISISPSTRNADGFPDERDFLREPLRSLLSPFLVLPTKYTKEASFQENIARTLLDEIDLEVISIWSPSYLLVLLDFIQANREYLASYLPRDRQEILYCENIHWEAFWPKLKLISCWDNAMSEPLAQQLRVLFPNVQVQGKGLLATEAPVTVPLISASGSLPLLREVFFEFETPDGHLKRIHELSQGEHAQVIITQQGGLTRYRLNDIIEVSGFYRNTPILVFIGRSNRTCDLTGEKLSESFVAQSLLPVIHSIYFILIPRQEKELGYLLLTSEKQENLEKEAEQALCQAHHYQLARNLKQLVPLQAIHVPNLYARILAFHQTEGMKLGNIKDSVLITDVEKGKRLVSFLFPLFNDLPSKNQQQPAGTVE